jgi:nitroreductase
MDFHDVVAMRRSVRAYRPDPVEEDKLERILRAGILAPSACNLQPVEIWVVTGEAREKLRRAYRGEWLLQAPVVLLVCSKPGVAWTRGDGKSYADVDATIVMDHLILAAAAEGLGTCWIGAFNPQALREDLGIPAELEPVALTPLGYGAEHPAARPRKPASEFIRRIC